MMIGPGGDYVTRFDVKGDGLIKTRTQATAGHDHDAPSSGNFAAWGWLPGRNKKTRKPVRAAAKDQYCHTEPTTLPATYVVPGLTELQQQHAMLLAIENWLDTQMHEVDRLAAVQTVTEAELARAGRPQTPLRVIRWNGGTMKLPTQTATAQTAEVPTPSPCHTFAADADAHEQHDSLTNPERNAHDGQPEPDAQADENFDFDSRHPALARLFADDARARRSLRRLQSHGLRTRRGADQKGLPDPGCEQGALFGAVA